MIRVAIFEDNLSFMKAMQVLIAAQPDMLLAYSAESLAEIGSLYKIGSDVVIMDIDLPGLSGIEGIRLLREHLPSAAIFVLTVFEEEEKIFESVKAGAQGYLLKKDPPEKIVEAIYTVHKGESILNGRIARKMLEYFSAQESKRQKQLEEYNLTRREKEILLLLIDGKSYKLIADECGISMQTQFTHIRNIYNKLNIHSRAEIAARFR
jgi:DNA-binding NarL/FixJ family response regulator